MNNRRNQTWLEASVTVQMGGQGGGVPGRRLPCAGARVCNNIMMKISQFVRIEPFVAVALVLGALVAPTAVVAESNVAAVTGKTAPVATKIIAPEAAKELEAKWGVQIAALRISAAGNVIDFRYRVTDADKAAALGNPKSKAELKDRATGKSLHVPNTKVGQMRSTGQHLAAGRTYTALFANPGKLVKSGNKVDIVIGDFRAEDLIVGE